MNCDIEVEQLIVNRLKDYLSKSTQPELTEEEHRVNRLKDYLSKSTYKPRTQKMSSSDVKELFVNRLRDYMSQLRLNREVNAQYKLGDVATLCVLAILCAETPAHATWQPERRKYGVWKHLDIWRFLAESRPTLERLLPEIVIPSNPCIHVMMNDRMIPEQFAELFIAWTAEVNSYCKSINVCDEESAMSGFNSKPKRVLIWAVRNWMEQNPKAEELAKGLFRSMTVNSFTSRIVCHDGQLNPNINNNDTTN